MSKEQINLSDALDLIAQSKSDIKDSVEYKGGIIGNDLTEYHSAIDNIEFNTLVSGLPLEPQIGDGTSQIKRYNSATYGLVDADYNDITMEILDNYVSAAKPEGWSSNLNNYYDPQAFIFTLEDDGYGKAVIDAEYNNVGWTQIKIHDNVGNVDFIKSYKTLIDSNVLTVSSVVENSEEKTITDNGDGSYIVDLEGNNNIEITVTPVINNKNYAITNRDVLYAEYIYDENDNILACTEGSGDVNTPNINDYVTISGNVLTVDSSMITNNGYIVIPFGACESTGEIEFDNDSSSLALYFNIGGGSSLHPIDVQVYDPSAGTASADKNEAAAGETVTITVSPNEGYYVDGLDINNGDIQATSIGNNQYTFEMPDEFVTVFAQILEN